jgi:hypothetical protein
MMFASLGSYENYTSNAYLWLLVGILFRLPELEGAVPTAMLVDATRSTGGLPF